MEGHEGGLGHGVLTDGRAVHEGLVRQVHQVVEHQLVVAVGVDHLAVAGPFGIVVPVQVGDVGRVGQGGIAHPHPDETVLLDRRIATNAGGGVDGLLRRHMGATTIAVEPQAVIAADHLVADQTALGQGQHPVPAAVGQNHRTAVSAAIHDQVPVTQGARQKLVLQLDVIGRRIPGVEGVALSCGAAGRCLHG
ncbi:hypothetical protein D3C72_1434300 [compost metagenome]